MAIKINDLPVIFDDNGTKVLRANTIYFPDGTSQSSVGSSSTEYSNINGVSRFNSQLPLSYDPYTGIVSYYAFSGLSGVDIGRTLRRLASTKYFANSNLLTFEHEDLNQRSPILKDRYILYKDGNGYLETLFDLVTGERISLSSLSVSYEKYKIHNGYLIGLSYSGEAYYQGGTSPRTDLVAYNINDIHSGPVWKKTYYSMGQDWAMAGDRIFIRYYGTIPAGDNPIYAINIHTGEIAHEFSDSSLYFDNIQAFQIFSPGLTSYAANLPIFGDHLYINSAPIVVATLAKNSQGVASIKVYVYSDGYGFLLINTISPPSASHTSWGWGNKIQFIKSAPNIVVSCWDEPQSFYSQVGKFYMYSIFEPTLLQTISKSNNAIRSELRLDLSAEANGEDYIMSITTNTSPHDINMWKYSTELNQFTIMPTLNLSQDYSSTAHISNDILMLHTWSNNKTIVRALNDITYGDMLKLLVSN